MMLVWLGLPVLLICCGADAPGEGQGGSAVPIGTPVRVEADPEVAVGVVQGKSSEEFHEVVTPFVLPGGSLAVPSAGHGEIRIFDRRGDFVRSYGGSGEGPGEFVRLGGAWARGDTIEAFDLALQRITRFIPDGRPEVVRLDGPYVTWVAGPISDGWVFVNTVEPGLARDNPRDQLVAYRFDRTGTFVTELARAEGIRRLRLPGRVTAEAFSPSARFDVWGDRLYAGETLVPQIQVFGPDGNLLRRIAWEPESIPPPGDALDEVRAALRERRRAYEPRILQRVLDAPLPDDVPVFTDFLVDEEGYVWVRPYVPARDAVVVGGSVAVHRNNPGGSWLVFDPDGGQVGSIVVPRDLEPYQITSDAVIGVARNQFGVERVRVHRVIRR